MRITRPSHTVTPLLGGLFGLVAALALPLLEVHDRAARADGPPGRYTAGTDADTTPWVKDNKTGLVWKKNEEPGVFSWAAAKTQCTGGTPAWRLPNLRELQSLVDETRAAAPTIDLTFFPGASGGNLWSSSSGDWLASGSAWFVDFRSGGTYDDGTFNPHGVRCVR